MLSYTGLGFKGQKTGVFGKYLLITGSKAVECRQALSTTTAAPIKGAENWLFPGFRLSNEKRTIYKGLYYPLI